MYSRASPPGQLGMLAFDRLFGVASCASTTHAATTGFAGISTDAALPFYQTASVLSRVYKGTVNLSLTISFQCGARVVPFAPGPIGARS